MAKHSIGISALLVVAMAAVGTPGIPGSDRRPLGEVDFFGSKGIDVERVRTALPFHEGDLFPPAKVTSADLKRQVSEKIKQAIGREPTSVTFVCCDAKQHWAAFIGLPGDSYQELAFNPPPAGAIRFPKEAVRLRDQLDDAWQNAVMQGHATEDDSEGYTLTNEPKARKAQLAIRDYALHNEALILKVLSSSSDAQHRAIAAQMLGYGRQSDEQIDALVHASLDPDEDVRNDAVRALEVLAGAKADLAQRIPPEPFIRLLRSGVWSDHNKASLLLVALTTARAPKILTQLRFDALDSLIEMARWRSIGHADAALTVLGRMAGIDEAALEKLIAAGQAETIVDKVTHQ
jgi:HEAT repeats